MMPQMQSTIFGFEETIQFQIVVKTVVDGDVAESSKVKPVLWFEGSLQPMKSSALLIKPEGERKFKWWVLFTDLELAKDDVIKDEDGRIYRVMGTGDWSQAGFGQYELIEGPGV